jgi:hypothetical protein
VEDESILAWRCISSNERVSASAMLNALFSVCSFISLFVLVCLSIRVLILNLGLVRIGIVLVYKHHSSMLFLKFF